MDLIIIGNGFDLNENLETSYENLKEYVETNNENLWDNLLVFYRAIYNDNCIDEGLADLSKSIYIDVASNKMLYPSNIFLWSKFEKNIANISYNMIGEEYGFGKFPLPNYDESLNTLISKYEGTMSLLRFEIKEWISNVNTQSIFQKKFINNSKFISFNYTKTLEDRYNVKEKNICYIHNSIKDKNIIFGCDKEAINDFYDSTRFSSDENDGHDLFAIKLKLVLKNYIKPAKKILTDKVIPFCENERFERIFVLGSSISEPDILYFNYLISKYSNAKWFVSYYEKDNNYSDLKNKKAYFYNKGLEIKYDLLDNLLKSIAIGF